MAGSIKIAGHTIAQHDIANDKVDIKNATLDSSVTFPAGTVVQTTQNTYNSGASADSTSQTTAKCVDGSGNNHWKHTISNMTAGNDVLVQMNFLLYNYKGAYYNGGAAHIYRDNTLIYTGSSSSYYVTVGHNNSTYRADNITQKAHVNLKFLDQGATGTSHTYFLGISGNNGVVRIESASHDVPYVCILQEISK